MSTKILGNVRVGVRRLHISFVVNFKPLRHGVGIFWCVPTDRCARSVHGNQLAVAQLVPTAALLAIFRADVGT